MEMRRNEVMALEFCLVGSCPIAYCYFLVPIQPAFAAIEQNHLVGRKLTLSELICNFLCVCFKSSYRKLKT
jgi:hypothetical protein